MVEKPGTVIVNISDPHIGSSVGLCLPKWVVKGATDKEDMPFQASLVSMWMYENWTEYWEYVKHLAGVRGKHRKHRIVTNVWGDLVEGNHHNNKQGVREVSDQVDMASEIFTQVANLSDGGVRATFGTPAHAGDLYDAERQIAQRCGFVRIENELHLDIDGIIVWGWHHGRAGARDWSSASASVAVEARLYSIELGEPAPHYCFTGHHHRIDDSGVKLLTRAMTMPSWQLRTTFGNKVASNRRADIGGIIILPNGQLDTSRMRYKAAPGIPKLEKV